MKKIHGLTYHVETDKLKEVINLALELKEITGMEPASLVLPSGDEIKWDPDRIAQFTSGEINEKDFIEITP